MGTQKEITQHIVDDDGDYVLALKNNHSTLRKAVEQIFAPVLANELPQIQPHFYDTVEKGHGRIEVRRYWMIDDEEIIVQINPKGAWKGLRSIGMVQSERTIGEIRDSRNPLLHYQRIPEKIHTFASAVRSHWGIENSVHWVLDIGHLDITSLTYLGSRLGHKMFPSWEVIRVPLEK